MWGLVCLSCTCRWRCCLDRAWRVVANNDDDNNNNKWLGRCTFLNTPIFLSFCASRSDSVESINVEIPRRRVVKAFKRILRGRDRYLVRTSDLLSVLSYVTVVCCTDTGAWGWRRARLACLAWGTVAIHWVGGVTWDCDEINPPWFLSWRQPAFWRTRTHWSTRR